MRIGLTYDLRETYLAQGWSEHDVAEFDRVETIDALAGALAELGHETDRIGGASALMERVGGAGSGGAGSGGAGSGGAGSGGGDRWDLVVNIAEGLRGTGREALVPAILDHHGVAYTFGDPLCCALTLDKPACKRVLISHGIPTAGFAVVESVEGVDRVDLGFPVFAKPSREGSSKGVDASSVCRSPEQLRAVCKRLLEAYRQPVLVESFLPGEEFTVGLVGTGDRARVVGVLGVYVKENPEVYGYEDKERCEALVDYRLVDTPLARASAALALEAYRATGCRDGGRVDVRADASGAPRVIEVNALAGLHPTHSDLPIMAGLAGWSYVELIGRIIASASERVGAASAVGAAGLTGWGG